MSEQETKPASQSTTFKGLGLVQSALLAMVVGIVAKKLGVTDSADISILKDSTADMIGLVLALVGQVGIAVAAIGRAKAKGPIQGVIKSAPAPAAAPDPSDPPY